MASLLSLVAAIASGCLSNHPCHRSNILPCGVNSGVYQMRGLGFRKLAGVRGRHASRIRDDYVAPDQQSEHANEVFQVLWEIGVHLAAFLGFVLGVNLLLVLFGIAPVLS
jgi:hypothetical protein